MNGDSTAGTALAVAGFSTKDDPILCRSRFPTPSTTKATMTNARHEKTTIESYPTFWGITDSASPKANCVPPSKAYETFILLCEDDFPNQRTATAESFRE